MIIAMKLKYQLTKTSEANNLSKQELLDLYNTLLVYNTRVPSSQEKHITYFHYNENNVRYILTRASFIMSGAFNLIDSLQKEIEEYKVLLNDPIIKIIKENNDKIKTLEAKIDALEIENKELQNTTNYGSAETDKYKKSLLIYNENYMIEE